MFVHVSVALLTDVCDWKPHLFSSGNKSYEKKFGVGPILCMFTSCDPKLITALNVKHTQGKREM